MAAALLGVGLTGAPRVNGRAHAIYSEGLVPAGQLAGVRAGALQAQRDLANLALARTTPPARTCRRAWPTDDTALDELRAEVRAGRDHDRSSSGPS